MQSWFDVEVLAKARVAEMERAAERQRLIEEAFGRERRSGHGHLFSFGSLLSNARAWLAMRRPVDVPAVERVLSESPNVSLIISSEQNTGLRVRPVASAEPYAGMVVIARGKPAQPLEEPSGVRDR